MRNFLYILMILLLAANAPAYSQQSDADNILLGGVVVGNDTIPMIFLETFTVTEKLPRHLVRKRNRYNKLKYNIYKVYPYAVVAADVLQDVDVELAKIDNKRDRKKYMNTVEQELKGRFKGELEDLTISQGKVLVKLINRQTGKPCFEIIKEVKSGFSAVVWQSVALLFNNNLKKEYDPEGEDAEMEAIVRELETEYYLQQNYKLQTSYQAQSKRRF